MTGFTHLDSDARPAMVDVGGKAVTRRTARAEARVWLPAEVRERFEGGDIRGPKGPVFHTAIIAGVMAAKKTDEWIPLCHSLPLDDCKIAITMEGEEAVIACSVATSHKTGVEMEALTGASVAALTLYDMCKALSHGIVIRQVRLLEKTGGKRDYRSEA
ncbi:MAG TPA: cyclic pyranopterin monophosphate synthase MoaC [Fibrobacteria bacterium]|nr:cyclic pyranopterin monophosphate synthase MoaC [Fibrobacteria bacterium]